MHLAYVLAVFLHILAAIVWVGGMASLMLVLVPWLRRGERAQAAVFLRETGTRLSKIGWVCFAVLAVSGSFNLWLRGVRWHSFISRDFLASPLGRIVVVKLLLFLTIVGLSAVHDFVIGPRATQLLQQAPQSAEAEKLRALAGRLGRLNALLALLIVFVAVLLVRGLP